MQKSPEQLKNILKKSSIFFRAHLSLMRTLILSIFIATIVLSVYLYYLVDSITTPPTYYFNQNTSSQVVTLSMPRLSNEAVLRWSSQAVSDIFTFNFAQDIWQHLQRIQNYFTPDGYDDFYQNLLDTGLLLDVVNKQLVYETDSCDVVRINNQRTAVINNIPVTYWSLQVPIIVKIQSNDPIRVLRYIVNIIVEGGGDVRPDKSIGIVRFYMTPAADEVCKINRIGNV